jgi:hypothetical protein
MEWRDADFASERFNGRRLLMKFMQESAGAAKLTKGFASEEHVERFSLAGSGWLGRRIIVRHLRDEEF